MNNLKSITTFCFSITLFLGFTERIYANECQLELNTYSAVSRSYGQLQISTYKILRDYSLLKITNQEGIRIIQKADDINTESLYELMKTSQVANDNISLLDAYAKLIKISLLSLDSRQHVELCIAKNSRKKSSESYMRGYNEGTSLIKRAYGLDKL